MQLLIKILSFRLRKSTSSLCYHMSSLAVRVNEELSDEEWTQSPRGGPRPRVTAVATAEGTFSIAAACWGLELTSVPTNVACHQNPIEPLVWTVSCSGNFFPWLHTGLLEMGLGVDGQSDPWKNCRVWGQLTSTACGCPHFWGTACVSYLLCLLLSERIHPWKSKLGWIDYSQNPELLEGGNGAEALPATFAETSIDMKARIQHHRHLWQQKCSLPFI